MKINILAALFLYSTSIFASTANMDWFDLELYGRYTLKQDLVFENGLSFKAGSQFDMIDFIAEGIPVAYFDMHSVECTDPKQTAELVLVEVEGALELNQKPVVIGAELTEGCNLGIFVELKDFFTKSIFSDPNLLLDLSSH